jgi:hypothetical protein
MNALKTLIRDTLRDDSELAALLNYPAEPKAIVDARDLPADYGASWAPQDARGRIQPHLIVRWRDSMALGLPSMGGQLREFELYAYQQRGYSVIDPVLSRAVALLHPRFLMADSEHVRVTWTFSSGELTADEYDGAAMRFSRYTVF